MMQRWVALFAAGLALLGLATWWLDHPTSLPPSGEQSQAAPRRQPEKWEPRGPLRPISNTPRSPEAMALVAELLAAEWQPSDRERITRLGDAATLPLIDAMFRARASARCSEFADALGWIGDRRAVPKLLEVLDRPAKQPPNGSTTPLSRDMPFDGCADAAVQALGFIGDPIAVPALINELQGPYVANAAQALGQIRDERAIGPLVDVLASDPAGFERASAALRKFNEAPLARVHRALKSASPLLKQMALRFLNESARITSPQICVPLLADPEPAVRREAILAISALRDAGHSALLVPLLQDADPHVRLTAAVELLRLGDRRGRDTLVTELPKRGDALVAKLGEYGGVVIGGEYGGYDLFALVRVVGQAADPRLIPWLGRIVADAERTPALREVAAESLGQMHNAAAATPLVATLGDWRTSRAVGAALVKLKWKPRTIEERVHFLVAQRDGAALRAMGPDARSVLVADLQSSDPRVLEMAASALIGLGQTDLVVELIGVLEHKGTVKLAEALLNSNQPELEKAARAWAGKRGYSIISGGGDHAGWSSF
jgi:HEAT repeat protein